MDGLNIGEVVAVSRYWTPQHIDMTYAQVEYTPNKPSWIERLDEHRALARVDSSDRAKRRAAHAKTYVAPEEIRALPPVAAALQMSQPEPVLAPALRTLTRWFSSRTDDAPHGFGSPTY